jgi:chromosome segregation ATPase
MTRHLFAIALAFASAPIIACTARDDHTAQTKSSDDFVRARERLVAETQTRLAGLDRRLATLKSDLAARSAALTTESKAALVDVIARLEDKRAALTRDLDDAKNATADRWSEIEKRTHEALKTIDDAYDAALKKLRDELYPNG